MNTLIDLEEYTDPEDLYAAIAKDPSRFIIDQLVRNTNGEPIDEEIFDGACRIHMIGGLMELGMDVDAAFDVVDNFRDIRWDVSYDFKTELLDVKMAQDDEEDEE